MKRSWQQKTPDSPTGQGPGLSGKVYRRNLFDHLQDEPGNESETPPTPTNRDAPKKPEIPPIYIHAVTNMKALIQDIKGVLSQHEFTYQALSNGETKVQVNSIDGYRELVKQLDLINAEYRTYQIKSERAIRVILRGLHFSFPFEDIKEELEKHDGIKVRQISKIVNHHTKKPFPSVLHVDLEPGPKVKSVFDIVNINGAIIKIESPYPNHEPPQCHRCQGHGHTKNYCRLPFVCVKCGGSHPTTQCQKPREAPSKCYHCGGPHTANYKGCPHYQKKFKQNPAQNRTLVHPPPPPAPVYTNSHYTTNHGESYANVTRGEPSISSMERTLIAINKNLEKQFEMMSTMMNSMMNMMTTVIDKLQCQK